MELVSYKNDPKLKDRFVKEVEKHRKQDMVIQKTYGDGGGKNWKGCAVACSLRSLDIINGKDPITFYNQHERYESELGIPEWLARLEDTLFEGLPIEQAKKWPTTFAKAIPVGINLDPLKWKFCAYLMKENIDRVLSLEISDELKKQVVDALRGVLLLNENAIQTGKWDESAAESARSAAESARSAAESAESAESAAWSAWSAARSARSAAYIKHSKYLITLLEDSGKNTSAKSLGSMKSEKKAKTARKNGKLGGRPKKK